MAAGRVLLLLGLACFAASAYGQGSVLQQVADGTYSGGNYLINGTGFVYDDAALTIFLNGTAVGTIPYGESAEAPGKDDEHDVLHKDKDGVYTFDFTKDKMTAPTPGADQDPLVTILGEIIDKPEMENPLDSIIIGRKMLL